MSEGQWLSEYRRQGRDWQFAWYLSGQRMKVARAILSRDVVEPWAVPILDWIERKMR